MFSCGLFSLKFFENEVYFNINHNSYIFTFPVFKNYLNLIKEYVKIKNSSTTIINDKTNQKIKIDVNPSKKRIEFYYGPLYHKSIKISFKRFFSYCEKLNT